ncbi:MAG: LysR family transcriptional regulator [Rhodoplanes sp.]|uniref:LysR family transcriptional regulator n=1 Tax=Rhodoplanes sp. TaxID=1968906 RepID=UPI001825DB24|nr:LysR family transcriptional regulator [Rhodoplanes sp.]NVO12911.1 LysR family transcriptional regulator [Rhodoplanes sp.]
MSIAERGNFQRAAAHLNLSQTALSHRIRKLEDDLGVKLLSRTTRPVTLTRAGLQLLPRAQATLEDLSAAMDEVRHEGTTGEQQLSIGCLPTIAQRYLPHIIRRFSERYPAVAVRVYDNSASEISELVRAGTAEFGLTIVAANRSDLAINILLKEAFVLVCATDHPLAKEAAINWSALAPYPLIRVSQQTGNRLLLDDALGSRREKLQWLYEVQHTATAVRLVAAGVGVTILPRLAVNSAEADIAMVPLHNPKVTRALGIVSRAGVPLSPLAEELSRMIVRELRKERRSTV